MNWPPAPDPRSIDQQLRTIEERLTRYLEELNTLTTMVIAANLDIEKVKAVFDLYSEAVVSLHDDFDNHEVRIVALEDAA